MTGSCWRMCQDEDQARIWVGVPFATDGRRKCADLWKMTEGGLTLCDVLWYQDFVWDDENFVEESAVFICEKKTVDLIEFKLYIVMRVMKVLVPR